MTTIDRIQSMTISELVFTAKDLSESISLQIEFNPKCEEYAVELALVSAEIQKRYRRCDKVGR